jgi:phage regulator Rha-like protein
MSDLVVSTHTDGVLVVDSRLVAEALEIEHESFLKTVEKYKTQAEQSFGVLRFEIGKPSGGLLGK